MYRSKNNRFLPIFAIAISIFCLAGCIPEKETTVMMNPDFSVPDTIELDFTDLHNDTLDCFGDIYSSPYVFVEDVNVTGSNVSETIEAQAVLMEGADTGDAEHFAAALVKHIGEAATNQYPSLSMGDEASFGEIFDHYALSLDIRDFEGGSLLALNIPAGEDIPLDPDIETYEEEWKEYLDLYLAGQEADEEEFLRGLEEMEAEEMEDAAETASEADSEAETKESSGTESGN